MAFTSYTIENDVAFRAALNKAKEAAGDLRLIFRLISADFYKSQKSIFQLKSPGKYPDLGGFQPNKKVSANVTRRDRAKARKKALVGFLYPLLRGRTRDLETAATVQGGAGNITLIGKQSLTMGVSGRSVPYAAVHQSDRTRRKIPQRKYLFIGPEAPRFATSEQKGRLERWLGIIGGNLPALISKQTGFANG